VSSDFYADMSFRYFKASTQQCSPRNRWRLVTFPIHYWRGHAGEAEPLQPGGGGGPFPPRPTTVAGPPQPWSSHACTHTIGPQRCDQRRATSPTPGVADQEQTGTREGASMVPPSSSHQQRIRRLEYRRWRSSGGLPLRGAADGGRRAVVRCLPFTCGSC
jgi:hypothetical protein